MRRAGPGPAGRHGAGGDGGGEAQAAPAGGYHPGRGVEAVEQAVIGKTTILLLHSWSALDVR